MQQENDYEIKNLDYFTNKLKNLLKFVEAEEGILTVRDRELKEEVEKILKDIETHKKKIMSDELYNLKHEFISIILDLKNEIEFNKSQIKPIKTDVKPYSERAYSKLNYLFRRNTLLTEDEAKTKYNDYDFLNSRYTLFLDLINWLNDCGLSIIPEKTLFSAYLGISVETYNNLLRSANDEKIRYLFKSIDEYFTTNQFGSLISNDRKSLERIQKTETFGQEMRQTQPDVVINNQTNNFSYQDIMQKVQRKERNIIDYKEIKEIK